MSAPKISLITVCFNSEKTIADTLNSVKSQDFKDFEYLVKDGGSSDGTVGLVEKSGIQQLRLVIKRDSGLYDAINQAIELARGEVIGFIHADDVLASPEVLSEVNKYFKENDVQALYGDLHYVSYDLKKVVRKWVSGNYKSGAMSLGWMPPHPTLYVRKEGLEKVGGYRTDIGSAADYEWMLRAIHFKSIKMGYLSKLLVRMRVGGMSNASLAARRGAFSGDMLAWKLNGGKARVIPVILKKLRKIKQYI